MGLFQRSVLKNYIASLDDVGVRSAYKRFETHFLHPEKQKNIRASKEEQYQEGFLRELFVDVLGYTINPTIGFNLVTEQQNTTDQKKADAAILIDGVIKGVVELKGTNTFDLNRVQDQAFRYYNNHKDAVYVVTSNFEKLRFYIQKTNEFEEFNLFTLNYEDFTLLYLCLSYDHVSKGLPLRIKNESVVKEQDITKSLYKDYSKFKQELFHDLCEQNKTIDKLVLFKATQKLIDRFLFIFFCEDNNGLLPANSIAEIIKHWNNLREMDEYRSLYEIFRKYFEYINTGRPAAGNRQEIFAYNGGLFSEDSLLDNLRISDTVLYTHAQKLSGYDFVSEVDVNILGHIFEHSLNDLEELQAELEGTSLDKTKTKRKKDGVFYTPRYITEYIVENTIGKLCVDKKESLGIVEDEYVLATSKKDRTTLNQKLVDYKKYLLSLTICDPACGSGAFLNQAFIFLQKEHQYIADLESKLFDTPLALTDVSADILENNLYGVDINEESVEIARLSLWLRSAKKGRKLNNLSSNIKCGNSLIDDPEVAGDKAFSWDKEFPHVFEKGGFDVVIGNPPYGIIIDKKLQDYYNKNFPLTSYKTNLYILFIERMFQIFSKGLIHFIIPKSLLFNTYYEKIRRALIQKTEINEIYTITEKVFEDAEVGSSLLLNYSLKNTADQNNLVRLVEAEKIENFVSNFRLTENKLKQSFFLDIPNCEISIISSSSQLILSKLYSLNQLKDFYSLKNGLNPGNIKHILISDEKKSEKHKPIIWGRDISRYKIKWSGQYINYNASIINTLTLEDIQSKEGMSKQERIDFALRSPDLFESRKIVIRKTGDSLIGCIDENNYYFDTLIHGIYENNENFSLDALICLLNSKPATLFYRLLHDIKGKVFAKISLDNLGSFPIPHIMQYHSKDLSEKSKSIKLKINSYYTEKENFSSFINTKFEILKSNKNIANWCDLKPTEFLKELSLSKIKLTLSEEKEWLHYFIDEKEKTEKLKIEIQQIEKEIDQKVYELYGLSDEEIKIVENGN